MVDNPDIGHIVFEETELVLTNAFEEKGQPVAVLLYHGPHGNFGPVFEDPRLGEVSQ
jgi:hypothetical protein